MKDKKLIILIVAVVGAIISLIYGITANPGRGARKASPEEIAEQDKQGQTAKKITPTRRRAKKTEFDSWGKNPFVPKGTPAAAAAPPKLVLDGIMWSETNPKAMVNNDIVGVGDKVGGMKVVDIKHDRVTLSDGTEELTLKLKD